MLIAVPNEGGCLASYFGRCREVAVFRVNQTAGEIEEEGLLDMPPHVPGLFPAWLRDQGVDLVIAGGMGSKALTRFAHHGIQVVLGAQEKSPRELVGQFLAGELVGGANACSRGTDHHGEHDAPTQR